MSAPQTPWRPQVDVIQDGELVNAQVANRPLEQLAGQTTNLKESIDNLAPGSGRNVYENAPVDSSVNLYDFVYFDDSTATYKPALAEAIQDSLGRYIAGPRSFVTGIVINKASSTLGDILQLGRLNLTTEGVDPNNLVDDPVGQPFQAGRFFLSNRIPGKITSSLRLPNIQVGFFTSTECHIQPLQKDLFEAHYHYNFDLLSKPSASQNFAQTGWNAIGTTHKIVDYFNQGGAATPPAIVLCVRPTPGVEPVDPDIPIRVELYNESGQLRVTIFSTNVDYQDPTTGDVTTNQALRAWPAYGEWISIPNTNLDVAFVRSDNTYSSSLATDAASLLTTTSKRFKVYLPTDLTGWTNANNVGDLFNPVGSLYRYLSESDINLNAAFPPVPAESALITWNGTDLKSSVDFKVTELGIFYLNGLVAGDYSPWPSDYSVVNSMSNDNAVNLVLNFIRSSLGDLRSVVTSLKGLAPLKITACPSGEPSSTGDLQASIDLNLLTNPEAPISSDTVLAKVEGEEFTRGTVVSELLVGPGLAVDRIDTLLDKNVGKLRLRRTDLKFEGEFNSIMLRNAKDVGSNPVAGYIDFLSPNVSSCGITGQFRVPAQDFDAATLRLKIFGMFRGDTSVLSGSADQIAIFKVVYHVVRPGFSMAAMNEGTAVAVQYWRATFPASYVAGTILSPELPFDSLAPDLYQIDATTLAANPASLVALSGGFQAGDLFSIQIDRVKQDGGGTPETYSGRVGLLAPRWVLL